MKENPFLNPGNNDLNIFKLDGICDIIPKKESTNFLEDEELIFNTQNENINQNINISTHLENNKNSHSSSVKTNATVGEISQKQNEDFSFFSLNNYENQNINIIEKKKELTKESIEMLNNIINKEKLILSNINILNGENNVTNYISIKDIKNNIFTLDTKLCAYFKRPYMRKNIKNKKNIIFKKYDDEQDEDEKIQFDKDDIKMNDIKDDDSKTNNDSCEEINKDFEKKKINKIKDQLNIANK